MLQVWQGTHNEEGKAAILHNSSLGLNYRHYGLILRVHVSWTTNEGRHGKPLMKLRGMVELLDMKILSMEACTSRPSTAAAFRTLT